MQAIEGHARDELSVAEVESITKDTLVTAELSNNNFSRIFKRETSNVNFSMNPNLTKFKKVIKSKATQDKPIIFIY